MIEPRPLIGAACLAIAALSACEAPADEGHCVRADGHREATAVGDGAESGVIVHFASEVDVRAYAANGRAGRRALVDALRADAERAQGRVIARMRERSVEPTARLWIVNAVAARLPDALIDEIAALPEVDRIEPDVLGHAPVTSGGCAAAPAWNLEAIRAPELWAAGHRGAGVVVATLDTGVDLGHPDLAASWRREGGWFDPHGEHAEPFDSDGPGTQVTGLVVGGDAGGTPIGVAPGARWISAKIFDDAGVAPISAIHLAMQWVLDPDGDPATDDAPDVVTASWGFEELVDECFLEFEPDIAALRAAQIATVFSAGNSGPHGASSVSPANNPSALAIGAIDDALGVIASSSRGPDACSGGIFPELVAPGANVRTTDLTLGGVFPDATVVASGTSLAAPHVAGAMALLRGAHPPATVDELEEALTTTAVDRAAVGPDDESGLGLPDLVAAEARLASMIARRAGAR